MSQPKQLKLSPSTRAAQALHYVNAEHGAVVPGIEPASTFARDETYAPIGPQVYARSGNPTLAHAEAVLADLDGAAAAMLFTSGMSATVAILETLRGGDHVVAPRVMYHGGQSWLLRMRAHRGIDVTFYDAADPSALEQAVRPGATRLVWVETPTNPNWDITDIAAAGAVARAAGARMVVDCTVCPACTTNALDLGADMVFQSATKYLNGHSDITGGGLSVAKPDGWWEEIAEVRTLQGTAMAAFEAWLLIRGLRTLHLRFERASANALALARHFEGHPGVRAVLYPGLESHPGHATAARQMTGGFGGMLSVLAHSEAAARKIACATQVMIPATSLGGVETLIEHRVAVEPEHSAVAPELLRISVGIEAVEDLIADLEQAIERAQ